MKKRAIKIDFNPYIPKERIDILENINIGNLTEHDITQYLCTFNCGDATFNLEEIRKQFHI